MNERPPLKSFLIDHIDQNSLRHNEFAREEYVVVKQEGWYHRKRRNMGLWRSIVKKARSVEVPTGLILRSIMLHHHPQHEYFGMFLVHQL